MTNYTMKITTLSPLHIGSGDELRLGFDFIINGGRTYRLNVDAILEDHQALLKPPYPLPGSVVREADLARDDYFRYILRGEPRSIKADARLQACIKDVYDQPYLPGSSLKGALRTALAWTGWKEVGIKLDRRDVGYNRVFAGQGLEHRIFGEDPNHDLLRALQVSDSFAKDAQGRLFVANAQVLNQNSMGTPIELESVLPETGFIGSLKVDDILLSQPMARNLGFNERGRWLSELTDRVQRHSHARLEKMREWFKDADGASRISSFIDQLYSVKPASNQALLQVGWGTGWDGKTFWTHLQQDEYLFEKLVSDFRMIRQGKRNMGDTFPKSRRVAMSVGKAGTKPLVTFGWCLLELKEIQ
ncbi:MAG: type III-A CRISPR-associated RAMP protein Csm5 [Anaerolineae bacterium]|nr:type III-A CRISPR-associated RAMP protein Csm5 [Anaerolineae bacterium]